ncbi:hypothetical protein AMTR_s00108p00093100 [Amborella trichopoda]|uniref:Uncharacterized protein n=1 Tax=Amborella trichopoda TaxID=13333 RepID=W1NVN8_AMBTC|nr:hypothetical protein AMTR_s00108p00093100 [Amborella trichopoda]
MRRRERENRSYGDGATDDAALNQASSDILHGMAKGAAARILISEHKVCAFVKTWQPQRRGSLYDPSLQASHGLQDCWSREGVTRIEKDDSRTQGSAQGCKPHCKSTQE